MAKNRADAPVETPPRMSEVVGEIDTRSPFQSVRDAVSLFRQASFSKQQQQPRLSSPSSSQVHSFILLSFPTLHFSEIASLS